MTDGDEHGPDDSPEQFTDETRRALERAVAALTEGLHEHARLLTSVHGGSSDTPQIFSANRRVEQLLAAWNDAVFDLTGTVPVALEDLDDEDEDGDDEDDDSPDLADGDPLLMVEQWDLVVTDADALLRAGREAHRRSWPKETERDAEAAVSSAAHALAELMHERGEPWYELPGIDVVTGARAWVRPDPAHTASAADDEPDDLPDEELGGEVLYRESWR